jgi:hypothetical protein
MSILKTYIQTSIKAKANAHFGLGKFKSLGVSSMVLGGRKEALETIELMVKDFPFIADKLSLVVLYGSGTSKISGSTITIHSQSMTGRDVSYSLAHQVGQYILSVSNLPIEDLDLAYANEYHISETSAHDYKEFFCELVATYYDAKDYMRVRVAKAQLQSIGAINV